jgi:class 3 adenylate cyclase
MQMANNHAYGRDTTLNDRAVWPFTRAPAPKLGVLVDLWHSLGLPPTPKTNLRTLKNVQRSALISLPVKRWSVSVLMVDLAGYSVLMDLDDLGTALRVVALHDRLLQPIAFARGGRVVNTSGDGALLLFGCASDALTCAAMIQRELAMLERTTAADRRLRLRMGISVGEVLTIASTLHGRAINVAARLMVLAEPDGICVCEVAFSHLDAHLADYLEPLGTQQLRNIAKPIRAFRMKRSLLAGDVFASANPSLLDEDSHASCP